MTTPSHETFREQLLDLAYGELPRREADALRRHLDGCAACRDELARMEGTRALMAGLPDEPAPEGPERILLAAARQAAEARHPARRLAWLWGAPVGALALLLVAVLSYRVASTSPHRPSPEAVGGLAAAPAAKPAPPGEALAVPEPAPVARNATREEAKPLAPAPRPAASQPPPARRDAQAKQDGLGHAGAPTVAEGAARQKGKAVFAEAPPEKKAVELQRDARAGGVAADGQSADLDRGLADASSARAVAKALPARPPQAPAAKAALAEAPPVEAEAGEGVVGGSQPAPAKDEAAGSTRVERSAMGVRAAPAGEDAFARHERLQVAGRLHTSTATFAGCPGESWREVAVDGGGRVVRYVRRGARGGAAYEVQLYYGEDGALGAARYLAGGRVHEVRLAPGAAAPEGIPAAALEPRRAEDAQLGAPPRCQG